MPSGGDEEAGKDGGSIGGPGWEQGSHGVFTEAIKSGRGLQENRDEAWRRDAPAGVRGGRGPCRGGGLRGSGLVDTRPSQPDSGGDNRQLKSAAPAETAPGHGVATRPRSGVSFPEARGQTVLELRLVTHHGAAGPPGR